MDELKNKVKAIDTMTKELHKMLVDLEDHILEMTDGCIGVCTSAGTQDNILLYHFKEECSSKEAFACLTELADDHAVWIKWDEPDKACYELAIAGITMRIILNKECEA